MVRNILAAVITLLVVVYARKRFDGDKVIQVTPATSEQLEYLKKLELSEEYDFWIRPVKVGLPVDIHVTQGQFSFIERSLEHLTYKVKVEDLQKLIANEKSPLAHHQFSRVDILNSYASQSEIANWLEEAAERCGRRCTLMNIGQSVEGREMKVIKITATGSSDNNKSTVFVDGGIHAREWISPVFVNNMINTLINNYGEDSEVTELLDIYDWYIIPLLNPDGYQYSHDSDRLWRKNRAMTSKRRCRGVDLNRNFGYQWGVAGVSSNPCSEVYCGTEAFSEPESRALRDFLSGLPTLQVYLTFHSYGQYFLYPWGYGREYAPNHSDLDDVGSAGASKIKEINGEDWIVGNSAMALYPSAGASDDWAYHVGANYSYTIELPPSDDQTGFILPEERIPEVVSSVWPGIKAMMKEIINKERLAYRADVQQKSVSNEQKLKSILEKLLSRKQRSHWEPQYI